MDMRFLKYTIQLLAATLGFLGGCLITVHVLLRLMTPGQECPSPCDAPAYLALGISLFAGPIVGVFLAAGCVYLVSRLFRGRR